MDVPVQFYQATAAIIPTLLIAFAITGKQGTAMAELMTNWLWKFFITIFALLLFFLIVASEAISLTVLMYGGGGSSYAIFVAFTILLMVAGLCVEFIVSVFNGLHSNIIVGILVLLCGAILGLIFVAFLAAYFSGW